MIGGFGYLSNLIWASVLFLNAIAILSEDRFLVRIGWSAASRPAPQQAYDPYADPGAAGGGGVGDGSPSIKTKFVHLIAAVRTLMRIPLILLNTFIIVYELALG